SYNYHDDDRHLHSFPTRRSSDLPTIGSASSPTTLTTGILIQRPITSPPSATAIATVITTSPAAQARARPLEVCLALALASSLASDRKSARLNSSHVKISYAVFCL